MHKGKRAKPSVGVFLSKIISDAKIVNNETVESELRIKWLLERILFGKNATAPIAYSKTLKEKK